MPKLTNAVPKYRKHRASGQAVVTIAGHDHYLGPHGTKVSKMEYDRLIAEWLAGGRRSTPQPAEDQTTVVELLAAYLRFAKTYYRDQDGKSTGYVERLKPTLRMLRQLYGHTTVASLRPAAIETIQQHAVSLGHSRSYVNQHVARIKRILRWGVSKELFPVEVLQRIETVPNLKRGRTDARENEPIKPVDDATVDATIIFLPAVVADMVRFQRLTGCRPQDVFNLRPGDIEMANEVWLYRPTLHKTRHHGHDRIVFVGPSAQSVLEPYLDRAKDEFCFSPIESEERRRAEQHAARKTPLSCGNKPGTNRRDRRKRAPRSQYDRYTYARAIQRACDKANVSRWSPNRLRHTVATEIRKRFGLEAAQIILGHSKADVTEIYAERDLGRAAGIMAEIG